MPIDLLLAQATELWHNSGTTFIPPGRCYTEEEQTANAFHLEQARATLKQEAANPDREQCHQRLARAFVRLARSGLSLEDRHANLLLEGGFSTIAPALEKQARHFDPAIADAEILQACRNAWTACGLQSLLGHPIQLTPAIFAYSMLYPYSDNVMDSATLTRAAKLAFSRRFHHRLAGGQPEPASPTEATIWRLIALIESQYPRPHHAPVYQSLLDIHHAQQESLRLFDPHPLPPIFAQVIFAKGGASVLADAFLAAATLTPSEAAFAFMWGVLLQLGDDLQDVTEDEAAGCATLFTEAAAHGTLDRLTDRTFHFAHATLRLMNAIPTAPATLKELIERSSLSLLVRAVGKNRARFSPAYTARLEAYSPVRFNIPHTLPPRMLDTGLRSNI